MHLGNIDFESIKTALVVNTSVVILKDGAGVGLMHHQNLKVIPYSMQ